MAGTSNYITAINDLPLLFQHFISQAQATIMHLTDMHLTGVHLVGISQACISQACIFILGGIC